MPRVTLTKFSTLLEAQAAITALESAGISASIDNEFIGSIMPHVSNAFGGFILSVDEADKEAALGLLAAVETEPMTELEGRPAKPPSEQLANIAFKKATYAALVGNLFLPCIAVLFSIQQYRMAHKLDPQLLGKRKLLLAVGIFCNLIYVLIFFYLLADFVVANLIVSEMKNNPLNP